MLAVRPGGVVAAVQTVSGVWVADAGRAAWLGVLIAFAWQTYTVGVVVSISALHAVGALVLRVTLVAHRLAKCVCQSIRKIKQFSELCSSGHNGPWLMKRFNARYTLILSDEATTYYP